MKIKIERKKEDLSCLRRTINIWKYINLLFPLFLPLIVNNSVFHFARDKICESGVFMLNYLRVLLGDLTIIVSVKYQLFSTRHFDLLNSFRCTMTHWLWLWLWVLKLRSRKMCCRVTITVGFRIVNYLTNDTRSVTRFMK